jgi:hypothetical protein
MNVVLIQRVNLVIIVIIWLWELSGSEQSDSSDDEVVNDDSDMQHGARTKVGAERPRFPFSGKPGLNVDLEDKNSPLEYFELFIPLNLPN